MGLFRRRRKPDLGSGPAEGHDADTPLEAPANAPRTVHERIEVTVERVWVSMVVRNSGAAMVGSTSAEAEMNFQKMLEASDLDLPKGE